MYTLQTAKVFPASMTPAATRIQWLFVGLMVMSLFVVFRWVDLSPRVEADFFFSRDDPQLLASQEMARRFPTPELLIVRAAGSEIEGEAYRSKVRNLTTELAKLPGVISAYSVTTEDAPRSPLWGPLLLNEDGRSTNLIALVGEVEPATLVENLETVLTRFERPDFEIEVSGVPYLLELIRRNLLRDLIVFSSAALVIFGLLVAIVYRQWPIVLGTLTACLTACAVTISLIDVLSIGIGLLTANLAVIVFVLTLSHIVFLTANWKRVAAAGGAPNAASAAVLITRWPSFWCMLTTFLGFSSLLVATAKPLRELGAAGAIGTVMAILIAYGVYPAFLRGIRLKAAPAREVAGVRVNLFAIERAKVWLVGIAVVVVIAGLGVPSLTTDPSLLSYFEPGSLLRDGLEAIDRDGGSSTLDIAFRDPDGDGINTDEADEKMWAVHDLLDSDFAVGGVISPVLLLEQARMAPFAGLFSRVQLLRILESSAFGSVGLGYFTPDRSEGHFRLWMREGGRTERRSEVILRARGYVEESGLEVTLVGGQYELQDQLGRLIASSLRIGLGALLILFAGIALAVSGEVRIAAVMVACLTSIPLVVLGAMGHLGLPVDIIASPGANVALAMGVDSMIHLVVRGRQLMTEGAQGWAAWREARRQLWQPVLGATLIISTGFGIFGLSTFPPTQRFGVAVIIGTLTAATMALVAVPFAASLVRAKQWDR